MTSTLALAAKAAPRPVRRHKMRVAINLLTEDPSSPSGAQWFWTRVIPEMAKRLQPGEELHLVVSPKSRPVYDGLAPDLHFITFPWSNERRALRTATEHIYSPARLPLSKIDVFNTLMAPLFNPTWSLVVHMKTMHAYTSPGALPPSVRLYRRMSYPRSARLAEAIIINSESLRDEVNRYLDVDQSKLRLIYEAVDHELFKPASKELARQALAAYGVKGPFVLFVSSLWEYKNCHGLLRAWAQARAGLGGRQLVVVGGGRDEAYKARLRSMVTELGISADVLFTGAVPIEQTAVFYQAADALVYPSFSETFGLPVLEAMACGCPVVTSDRSSMPEISGGAALLADPGQPASIASALLEALGPAAATLKEMGLRRAQQFSWGATAAQTLDVYREVAERRQSGRASRS
jgi:glycosyltransferase involved in cell wall biosynthesis